MRRRPALVDWAWLVCFGVASSLWCWSAAARLGATFDEPTYLRCGSEHWHTGSYKQLMRLGAMPLAIDVQTLPVHLLERWRGAPLPFAEALRLSRTATLLFWWILLFYAFRAGHIIDGHWGGRLSVALIACEPMLLGHAALATSDIAVAAFLLILTVEFYGGRQSRWPRRVALPAVIYGLAVLAKASALVFGPLCLLALEAQRVYCATKSATKSGSHFNGETRRGLLDIALIVTGGLAVTFLYCGSDWSTEPTFVQWAQTLPSGRAHDVALWTSQHLRIFSNAGEGLVQQIKHNIRGHSAFILGREYRRAVWFYFPAALTMKMSLSLLVGTGVIAVTHRAALRNWACLIALVLLVYSLTCRVQNGVRLMLPLVVFLSVGVGAAAASALRESYRWKCALLITWLIGGLGCTAFAAVRVWPEGICFTNAFWGGTPNGYRLLSDSNYDWGQGLPELRRWQEAHGETEVNVWYFGADPAVHLPPLHELPLHRIAGLAVAEAVKGKLVAVSMTLLYGAYTMQPPAAEAAAWFRDHRPIDRTTTFLLYDFRDGVNRSKR